MQLERATTERIKLGRPFAILVLTPQLQIFRNTWGDVSRGEFQCIHILRPFKTGASRPMSTHRMVRALAGEIATMKETHPRSERKQQKKKSRKSSLYDF
jgi:hypothetical protein